MKKRSNSQPSKKRTMKAKRTQESVTIGPGANHCVVLAIGIVSTPGKKPPTPIESQNNPPHHSPRAPPTRASSGDPQW